MTEARGRGELHGDRLMAIWLGVMVAFSLLPLAVLAVFSVNDFPYFSLPFRGLTLGWYEELLHNQQVGDGLRISIVIALAAAVVATLLGGAYAVGGAQLVSRRAKLALGLGLLPLVTPALVLAIGAQIFFVQAGIPLSRLTVIASHATAFTPFVVLMVTARLSNYNWNLLHAARDLGAGPVQAFRAAMLPAIKPGLISGFLIAALMSFSDYILASFTGRGFVTLPALIYSMQKVGISPMLLAYSTVLVVVAACVALAARSVLVSISNRRRSSNE